MVDRAVSDADFLHVSDDRLECFRVLGCISVELYVADVAGVCQIVIWRLDVEFLECADRIVYRNMERVGVVIPVCDARQLAVFLSVDLDETA